MKTILLSMTFTIFFSSFVFSQIIPKNSVPDKFNIALNEKFPRATDPTWEKFKDYYEVTFTYELEDMDLEARFDYSSNWIATITELNKKNLPEAIKLELFKKYSDYDIEKLTKLETLKDGIIYEIELKDEKDSPFLLKFSENGTFIEKSVIKEDEED